MKTTQAYLIVLLALLLTCGTCLADHAVGQPVPLDGTGEQQSTGHFQSNPVVAGSASLFMAVWVDMRDAGRTNDLFAALLGPTGDVLPPGNIRLTTHACVLGKPDICFNGHEFFVAYADGSGPVGNRIRGMVISGSGTVLVPTIEISSYRSESSPCVSWDGTNYVVAWTGDGPDGFCAVYAVRVGPAGAVVDSTPINIAAGSATWDGSASIDPSSASSASGDTLIVWGRNHVPTSTSNNLYGAVLDGDTGSVLNTNTIIYAGTTSQDTPDCCWAGDHFKVVWADGEPVGREIKGRRVSALCTVLDTEPWTVSSTAERQYEPRIAWNGTHCIATWTRKANASGGIDVYAGRLDASGAPLDGSGFAVCSADGRQVEPGVALMREGTLRDAVLFCWMDDRASVGKNVTGFGYQVRAAAATLAGGTPSVGTDCRLAESAPQHSALCSAYGGGKFLTCWEEWTEAGRTMKGEVIDAYSGQPAGSAPFVITSIGTTGPSPAACWNGEHFVVTWLTDADVRAARISPSGVMLDPAGITIAVKATSSLNMAPAIASDGNNCLIVYRLNYNIRAAFFSRQGTVLSDSLVFTMKSVTNLGSAAVCWTGQSYLVAWRQPYHYSGQVDGIDYTTVTPEGVVAVHKSIVDSTAPQQFRLAFDGQNALLISRGTDIRSRRISPAGTLLDTTPLVVSADGMSPECLSLAWDGIDFVFSQLMPKPDMTSVSAAQDDVQIIRISRNNQLIGAAPVDVANTLTSEIGLAACAGPAGRMFFSFAAYEDAPYRSARIRGLYLDTLMNVSSLTALGRLYEGAYVSLPGQLVSASFPGDRFYVQYYRTFGIGVKTAQSIPAGSLTRFSGRLKNIDGETMVDASSVTVMATGTPSIKPLGMPGIDLGGLPPASGYASVTGARGLYNVGLLVKTWGRVTHVGDGFFYLDDGSLMPPSAGPSGVKVYSAADPGAVFVTVTGISGSEQSGSEIVRVIRAVTVQPETP